MFLHFSATHIILQTLNLHFVCVSEVNVYDLNYSFNVANLKDVDQPNYKCNKSSTESNNAIFLKIKIINSVKITESQPCLTL